MQTWGNIFFALPRRGREERVLEGDLDIGMIRGDPVEDLGWYFEG